MLNAKIRQLLEDLLQELNKEADLMSTSNSRMYRKELNESPNPNEM